MTATLITGGHGFLGSYVRELLPDAAAPTRLELDWLDPASVAAWFHWHPLPNRIIHLAAKVGGIGANQQDPAVYWRDNVLMGVNVLEACRRYGVEHVTLVGSVCAYPAVPASVPFVEDELMLGEPEPTNAAYGHAKRSLLAGARAYRAQYGREFSYLVPANLYGPGDHRGFRSHVVPALVEKLSSGEDPVRLWGDGSPTRDFLYVTDAARAIVRASQLPLRFGEPVNLGTGVETSIRELAAKVAYLVGYTGEIVWDASRPGGQQRRVLDCSRAKDLLGWEASTPLDVGLAATVAAQLVAV